MPNEFYIIEPPPANEIPIRLKQVYDALQKAPARVPEEFLDFIVAALVSLSQSYKTWILPHLGDFEPDEIMKYGPMLDSLDRYTTDLSDAVLKYQAGLEFMKIAYHIIDVMRDLWNLMDRKNLT